MTGSHAASGQRACLRPSKKKKYWLRSVAEWLEEAGLYMWKAGSDPAAYSLASTIGECLTTLTKAELTQLSKGHLFHLGDIVSMEQGTLQWAIPAGMEFLRSHLPGVPPTDNRTLLWPGQFWREDTQSSSAEQSDLLEIEGLLDDGMVRACRWCGTGAGCRFIRAEKCMIARDRLFQGEWGVRSAGGHETDESASGPSFQPTNCANSKGVGRSREGSGLG